MNRIDIDMAEETGPLLVRTGAFLRHPDAQLTVPCKGRLIFSRLSLQLYWMFKVNSGKYTLTTPYGHAYIVRRDLVPGEAFFVKLQHLLAFTESMFPRATWKLDLTSLLTRQFRYIYVRGPGRLYLFGLGYLSFDELRLEDGPADDDQGAVLGFTSGLRLGVTTRSSLSAAMLAREDICLDRFVGAGGVLTQASTAKRLPEPFHNQGARNTVIDYANALLGVRM